MEISISLIIVIITCLVSIGGFNNEKIINDLIFHPPSISSRNQYYRFITHGLIHADFIHLAFNMLALYSFGEVLEQLFNYECIFGSMGKAFFLLLYIGGLIVASIPDYIRYKDNYQFRSLGASGAVCGVVFATVVLVPKSGVGFAFIPGVTIPGYLFAVLYLAYCIYMDKRDQSKINHSAHLWGSVYGLVFTLVFVSAFGKIDIWQNFQDQLKAAIPFLPDCDL